ncbi:MAG: DUF3857 domain-containing protein [Candidatus Neomarinimicrobiota bacterium]
MKYLSDFFCFLLIILLWIPITGVCGSDNYVIYDRQEFKLKSSGRGVLSISRRAWVANEAGKDLGTIILTGDKYITINKIKGAIISPSGKILRKINKKDIRTYEGSSNPSIYSDQKHQAVFLTYPTYPYYVEYSYEKDFLSLFLWPEWSPQGKFEVKEASYSLFPANNIAWKMYRSGKCIDSVYVPTEDKIIWKATNIPPNPEEYRMCPENKDTIGIWFSPTSFEIDGYTGLLQTWNDLGDWYRALCKEQYKIDFKELEPLSIDPDEPAKEIVRKAYRFIQRNTHYNSVSLGIYGWKPHSARAVLKNRYGDCKDLATLFIGILRCYNIPAYPVILLTRNYGVVQPDFPMITFNHVIAYVPLPSETLWVDCTTNNNHLENIPDHDEGASALVVFDDKASFTTIPISKPETNQSVFAADIAIGANGNARLVGKITFTGDEDVYFRDIMSSEDDQGKKEIMIKWLGEFSPDIALTSYTLPNFEEITDTTAISFDCSATNYASLSHNRLFLNPGFYFRVNFRGEKPERRTTSVYYSNPHIYTSRISYLLPEGYNIEAIPPPVEIENEFGRYSLSVQLNKDRLLFDREFRINQKVIPLAQYKEYYDFMRQCEKTDNQKVICKRQR